MESPTTLPEQRQMTGGNPSPESVAPVTTPVEKGPVAPGKVEEKQMGIKQSIWRGLNMEPGGVGWLDV